MIDNNNVTQYTKTRLPVLTYNSTRLEIILPLLAVNLLS